MAVEFTFTFFFFYLYFSLFIFIIRLIQVQAYYTKKTNFKRLTIFFMYKGSIDKQAIRDVHGWVWTVFGQT